MKTDKKIVRTALKNATPVARKFAAMQMKGGKDFSEISQEFDRIGAIEKSLYGGMKDTLISHIRRHGLDAVSLGYFDKFVQIKDFDLHDYQSLLGEVRKAYVKTERRIGSLERDLFNASSAVERQRVQKAIKSLQGSMRSIEYLVAKFTEFLKKVDDLAVEAYKLVESGEAPDFAAWRDKMIAQNALFEENKQFLKQSLHHIEVLDRNKVKLGVNDLRLLLYNRQGARREKLYCEAERWIIKIYYGLDTEEERRSVYKDICDFVAEVVPLAGYISPIMIGFILDRDFLSKESRDLLLKIRAVVAKISMTSLVVVPLQTMFDKAVAALKAGNATESDKYVAEVMKSYSPKSVPAEIDALLK